MLHEPYTVQYGLWLNLNRVRAQGVAVVQAGTRAGSGDEPLPRAYYDGVCGLESQVDITMCEDSLDRATRRLLARSGRG